MRVLFAFGLAATLALAPLSASAQGLGDLLPFGKGGHAADKGGKAGKAGKTVNVPAVKVPGGHGRHGGGGAGAAAGIIGLAAGLVAVGIAQQAEHVADCRSRYKSYDQETDTYAGSDGRRHKCE